MPMKLAVICLTLMGLLSVSAQAQNIGFLTRGPVAQLSDDDKALLSETLRQALNEAEDNETVTWGDPDSGPHGQIEVFDTHEDFGTTCRSIRTRTTAAGRSGGGVYRLCLADDDSWRFAPRRRSDNS